MQQESDNIPRSLGHLQFLLLGLTALLGYNAVMNTLDYFASKYVDYDVYFLLTIPYIALCVATSAIIYPLSNKLSIKLRLTLGLWSSAAITILLPIAAEFFPNSTGFYITMCILMPCLGIANSLVQSSGFAFSAILSTKCPQFITTYCIGTGFAGIVLSVLRMIVLASFKDEKASLGYQVLSFFGVATVLVLMAVLCNAKFMTNQSVKKQLQLANTTDCQSTQESQEQDWIQIPNDLQKNLLPSGKSKKNLLFLLKTCKKTQPYMFLLLLVYIQTYLLFPGMTIEKSFIPGISNSWKLVLLTFDFNCFDTLGKYLSQYSSKISFSKVSTSVFVFIRFLFFPLAFLAIYVKADIFSTVWFPFAILSLFSFTNGFFTGVTMTLGPSNVAEDQKETAGFLMSFALVTGILIGMFSALPFQNFSNVNA